MTDFILILGGARSGKSHYAQELAWEIAREQVLYVATAEPLDDEMRQRISVHRAERPDGWQTLEQRLGLGSALETAATARLVLVDCITLLVNNILMERSEDEAQFVNAVEAEVTALMESHRHATAPWLVVSNELGLGLVPDNRLGRVYRDALGRANQQLAAYASKVLFMVAGIPMTIKG